MRRAVLVAIALGAFAWQAGCQALLDFGDRASDGGSDGSVADGGGPLDGESPDARSGDAGSVCSSSSYALCDDFEVLGPSVGPQWNGFWGAGPRSVFSVVAGGAGNSVGSARFLSAEGNGQLYLWHEIPGAPRNVVCEFWLKVAEGSKVIPFSFGYDQESLDWRVDGPYSSLHVRDDPPFDQTSSMFPTDAWRAVKVSIADSTLVNLQVGGASFLSGSFSLSKVQNPRLYFGLGILDGDPATVWFDDIRCTVQD